MTGRIHWKLGTRGRVWLGYVGTHKPWMFQVWTGVGHEVGWQLIAQLPGLDERLENADPDVLKARAEELLEQFVTSLGAVFPDDKAAPAGEGQ